MAKKKMYQRSDGLYEAIRMVGGKRKAFRGKSIREVEQKMIAYHEDEEKGPIFKTPAEAWWEEFMEKAAPNSLKGYKPAYRRAVEQFGNQRLSDISAKRIKAWLNCFIKKGFAKKTIQTHLIVMSNIFKYAQEEYNTNNNPALLVRLPSDLPQKRRELPSDEDDARMLAHVKSHPFGLFAFLAKYTGARRGELLGLRYGDFNFNEMTIRIERSVYHEGNTPKLKSPKTEAGIRTVPLLNIVAQVMPYRDKNDYIFGGSKPLTNSKARDLWEDYCKVSGVTASPHQWRHLYATILFDADIAAKDAQVLMGHAQFSTTMDIYTHVRDQRIAKSAKKLNLLFDKTLLG